MEQKQQLPNATAVLVLGICSIVFSALGWVWFWELSGLYCHPKAEKCIKKTPLFMRAMEALPVDLLLQ